MEDPTQVAVAAAPPEWIECLPKIDASVFKNITLATSVGISKEIQSSSSVAVGVVHGNTVVCDLFNVSPAVQECVLIPSLRSLHDLLMGFAC